MRRLTLARCHGFTIVEVTMAATIMLVGIVGLIDAVATMSEALDTARKQQVAVQIISAEIERLRGKSWSAIANLPASATIRIGAGGAIAGDATSFALSNYTAATTDDNTALASLGSGFTCTATRTWLRPAGATAATATFVKMAYTITWTSNTGRAHSHVVETYLGQNGLHLSYQQS